MLSNTLIFDFSRAYPDAGFTDEIPDAETIDLSGLEGTVCYCDSAAAERIKAAVAGRKEKIHWIDSGDFHYVTKLLTDSLTTPFTLVLFDHHPDDQAPEFEGMLSCGSWVRAMREENPYLEGVVSIGPETATGLQDLGGKRVWLSIDKDVLSPDYARTDWSQGTMTLPELEQQLEQVFAQAEEILGVDICGEKSTAKGATPEDRRINLTTNIELQRFITNHIN